jgi:hypothetical protein
MTKQTTHPSEPEAERQAQYRRAMEDRRQAAFALLHDPQAFAAELWEPVFVLRLDALFLGDTPCRLQAAQDEAFRLVELATQTPGADATRAIGLASDITNDLSTESQRVGVAMGVALECLRRSLLDCWGRLQSSDDGRYAQQLHELRRPWKPCARMGAAIDSSR